MENKEDKILTEHMRDYLNHRGITPNKFAGELMLPNGKPMNMATIYRQLNGESVNLKEQTRFAIKNHKGLQEFIATKQSVQTIKDCAVLGSVKDGIVLPNNPNDPQTLSFESLKITDDKSHFTLNHHPQSRDVAMTLIRPIFKRTPSSPHECERSLVYVVLKPDWSTHHPTLLEVDKSVPTLEDDSRIIFNSHLKNHTNFYGTFDFLRSADEPVHDIAFMETEEYFDLDITITLMPSQETILFPLRAIQSIHRVDMLLEPAVATSRMMLAEVLRQGKSALWSSDVFKQYEAFTGLRYQGLLDLASAQIQADKIVGRERFTSVLNSLYKKTFYRENHFKHEIYALNNCDPTIMESALKDRGWELQNLIQKSKDTGTPTKLYEESYLELKRRLEDWSTLVSDWKVAFNNHCKMQIELGADWKGNIVKMKSQKKEE